MANKKRWSDTKSPNQVKPSDQSIVPPSQVVDVTPASQAKDPSSEPQVSITTGAENTELASQDLFDSHLECTGDWGDSADPLGSSPSPPPLLTAEEQSVAVPKALQ